MRNHATSNLTASRKNRVCRRAARPDPVDWRDAMDDRCLRLDMMAELFQACGQPLEPEAVARAGYWMSQELRALKALLDEAGKGAR
jgi:hypothetical protein